MGSFGETEPLVVLRGPDHKGRHDFCAVCDRAEYPVARVGWDVRYESVPTLLCAACMRRIVGVQTMPLAEALAVALDHAEETGELPDALRRRIQAVITVDDVLEAVKERHDFGAALARELRVGLPWRVITDPGGRSGWSRLVLPNLFGVVEVVRDAREGRWRARVGTVAAVRLDEDGAKRWCDSVLAAKGVALMGVECG